MIDIHTVIARAAVSQAVAEGVLKDMAELSCLRNPEQLTPPVPPKVLELYRKAYQHSQALSASLEGIVCELSGCGL